MPQSKEKSLQSLILIYVKKKKKKDRQLRKAVSGKGGPPRESTPISYQVSTSAPKTHTQVALAGLNWFHLEIYVHAYA